MKVFLFLLILISTVQAKDSDPSQSVPQAKAHSRFRYDPYAPSGVHLELEPLVSTTAAPDSAQGENLAFVSPGHSTPSHDSREEVRLDVDPLQKANDLLEQAMLNNRNLAVCPGLYHQALELFDSIENIEGIVSCRIGLGMNCQGIAHFDRAIELLLKFPGNPTRNNELARAYLGKANALRGQEGNFDNVNALIVFAEAKKYAEAGSRLLETIIANEKDCMGHLSAPTASREPWRGKSHTVSQRPVARNPLLLLEQARSQNGDHHICVPLYREALALFQTQGDLMRVASCYTGLGMNHAGVENFDLAIDILKTLRATQAINNMWAQCQLGKANFFRSKQGGYNNAKALVELEGARQWATDDGLLRAIDRVIESCRLLVS